MDRGEILKSDRSVLQTRGPKRENPSFTWPICGSSCGVVGQRASEFVTPDYALAFQDRGEERQPIAMRSHQHLDLQILATLLGGSLSGAPAASKPR